MTSVPAPAHAGPTLRPWPGLDPGIRAAMGRTPAGDLERFQRALRRDLGARRGTPCRLGPPVLIRPEYAAMLRRFVPAYHRAIETIVDAHARDPAIREVLTVPPSLREDVEADWPADDARIHLCRIDLLLDPGGGFRVLETNANCPGALLSCGVAGARWRERLLETGARVPEPLAHESRNWMARWLIRTAYAETGVAPPVIALFRVDGGNRLELPGLAAELASEGVEAIEADPRELTLSAAGEPSVRGRRVRHGYLKVGLRELGRMRPQLDAFADAVRRRRLFVQNGFRGRLLADNKLCLAVLSDPAFATLFDPGDLDAIRDHVPWSRAIARCAGTELDRILKAREGYVLKRPLDTRGRGVVIGREIGSDAEWERAVELAMRDAWLVQEFCDTAGTEVDLAGTRLARHDLSLGVTGGELAGAFSRSSAELRLNAARSGRLHPVFVGG